MSGAIRVLVDYRPARYGRGGIRVYVQELVRALAAMYPEDHYVLHAEQVRGRRGAPPGPSAPNVTHLDAPVPSRLQTVAARFGWGLERRGGGAEVIHWTDYVQPPTTRRPLVATIHDVLFETLPHCYTAGMRRGLGTATRRLARAARRFLVPSETTRRDLVAFYGVDPDRIDVVPHGTPPLPDAQPVGGYGRYLLTVGTLEPRKNLARLLDATERLDGVRLVVAGPRGWMDDEVVTRMAARPDVVWEGAVGRERLSALYRGAVALAYPSLGEGFGLPVLEALSVGCPVVVGVGTAPAEVAGDAGLAVDPLDAGAIAAALRAVLDDDRLHASLAAAAPARVGDHDWARAAAGTRRAYERAA